MGKYDDLLETYGKYGDLWGKHVFFKEYGGIYPLKMMI